MSNFLSVHFLRALALCLAGTGLASCGVGVGLGLLAEGGISGTGISFGAITGLGSIFSNGIKFNTDDAEVTFEGFPGSDMQLKTGMVVSVVGEFDTQTQKGTAETVDFSYTLLGEVEYVDLNSGVIHAIGQSVLTDGRTVFDDVELPQFVVGDFVAVSGFINVGGAILSTYVNKIPQQLSLVVEGVVTNFDSGNRTFDVFNALRAAGLANGLVEQVVDYSGGVVVGFGGAVLGDGSLVRIEGELSGGGVLNASMIENRQEALNGLGENNVLLHGLVTEVPSSTQLGVAGNTVQVNADTQFINGSQGEIDLDHSVRIEGRFDEDGRVIAEQVIQLSPTHGIEAYVENIELNTGSIELLGLTLSTTASTLYIDSSSDDLSLFSIDDLAIGDRLILSVFSSEALIEVSRLERVDDPGGNAVSIQGPVEALPVEPGLSILGLAIDTAALQDNTGFFEGDQLPVTRNRFYGSVGEGLAVRSSGIYAASVYSPTSVTLLSCCRFLMPTVNNGFGFGFDAGIIFNWDGTLYTDPDTQIEPNMSMVATNTFFGHPYALNDIRAFGPGDYSFMIGGGDTRALHVGPDQIGAKLTWNWNTTDFETVVLWDRDEIGAGVDQYGVPGKLFSLVGVDPGQRIVTAPFQGKWIKLDLSIPPHP
ncbi:MAG TPA: hypothetical protein EYM99_09350 [Alphaproteobacteria bacterium]|jgi:hypothetical protein|nr:hypothetical protein [Alphaproteobacteria bacterium]